MTRRSNSDGHLERLKKVCLALPEAEVVIAGHMGEHMQFRVRRKTFAYHVVNEHGDGRIALCCKAAPGVQGALVASNPGRYYVPKYIGHRGWVCLDLDAGTIDWREIEDVVRESYRLIAPKRLAAQVQKDNESSSSKQ